MISEGIGFERQLSVITVADAAKEVFSSVLGAHATDAESGSDVSFDMLDVDP